MHSIFRFSECEVVEGHIASHPKKTSYEHAFTFENNTLDLNMHFIYRFSVVYVPFENNTLDLNMHYFFRFSECEVA